MQNNYTYDKILKKTRRVLNAHLRIMVIWEEGQKIGSRKNNNDFKMLEFPIWEVGLESIGVLSSLNYMYISFVLFGIYITFISYWR
jgi:hypothetical protein